MVGSGIVGSGTGGRVGSGRGGRVGSGSEGSATGSDGRSAPLTGCAPAPGSPGKQDDQHAGQAREPRATLNLPPPEPAPAPSATDAGHQAARIVGVHRSFEFRIVPGRGASGSLSMPVTKASTSVASSCAPATAGARRVRRSVGEGLAVRPTRRHRREGIGDREDPGDERDVLAGEPGQVALAVPALVVVADAGADVVDVGHVADDEVAERDVLLDDLVLVRRQAAGLAEDVVRDADLADVVEERRDPQAGSHLLRQAQPLGEEQGVGGDVLGVELRVAVLAVDRQDEALQHVEGRVRRPRIGGPRVGDGDAVAAAAFASPSAVVAAETSSMTLPAWNGK